MDKIIAPTTPLKPVKNSQQLCWITVVMKDQVRSTSALTLSPTDILADTRQIITHNFIARSQLPRLRT